MSQIANGVADSGQGRQRLDGLIQQHDGDIQEGDGAVREGPQEQEERCHEYFAGARPAPANAVERAVQVPAVPVTPTAGNTFCLHITNCNEVTVHYHGATTGTASPIISSVTGP